ncbi:MAG: hypothetical protein JNL01_11095 [Bdellovibrionales bacterium]|nr:hypothetical protein [Bdellovibrionales bacterium]
MTIRSNLLHLAAFGLLAVTLWGCGTLSGSSSFFDPVPGTDVVRTGSMNCSGTNAGTVKVYRVSGFYVLRLEGLALPSSVTLPLFVTANVSGTPNVLFSASLKGSSGDQNYNSTISTGTYAPSGWAVVELRQNISAGSASCTGSLI